MPRTARYEMPRVRLARAARRVIAEAREHLRASLRAAYGTAVLCSGLLVGLTSVAAGVRL